MKTVTQREAFEMMGVKPETVERYRSVGLPSGPISDRRYPVEMVEAVIAALRGE